MKIEGIIGIQDEAFKEVMNKLERILSFVKQASPLIEEYIRLKESSEGEVKLLNTQQACLLLNVSRRTLERYKKAGAIPFLQFGGKVMYDYNELINCRNNRKHKNSHTDYYSMIISAGNANEKQ